ncbi:MAG: tetratricopeptide repeat protein [Albidovulum sp.]|nr:tetratricopeptide repeat protein [Albidovulum sp.]MDE0306958.1 tetratricopeptide repeat protein [Albidovulum sp.]MDE0532650.1 tetratricopeptide repeat protein [Albidovulum sp.]
MSNTDSFIDEVTDEVRRDKLFAKFRRYGWIGAVAIVAIVALAGYREWSIAEERAAAESLGDAMFEALALDAAAQGATKLTSLQAESAGGQAVLGLIAASRFVDADDRRAALDELAKVANNSEVPDVYRDLAVLHSVAISGRSLEPDARLALLTPLSAPGEPFSVLAQEQSAYALLDRGDRIEAADKLESILAADIPPSMRRRIQGILIALGRNPVADASGEPGTSN